MSTTDTNQPSAPTFTKDVQERVFDYLNQMEGGAAAVNQIASALSLNRNQVHGALNPLKAKGVVEKLASGVWRLDPSVRPGTRAPAPAPATLALVPPPAQPVEAAAPAPEVEVAVEAPKASTPKLGPVGRRIVAALMASPYPLVIAEIINASGSDVASMTEEELRMKGQSTSHALNRLAKDGVIRVASRGVFAMDHSVKVERPEGLPLTNWPSATTIGYFKALAAPAPPTEVEAPTPGVAIEPVRKADETEDPEETITSLLELLAPDGRIPVSAMGLVAEWTALTRTLIKAIS